MNEAKLILKEYDEKESLLKVFQFRMQRLVEDLLYTKKITVHNISSRMKEKVSLEKKIHKKGKYRELSDITDIIGVRVITLFEDQVDAIANILKDEFTIDNENSIDKRITEFDRFGYASLHFVVSIKKKRETLTEFVGFKDLKFEIQIRSILQHAWAEIEHDLGYKTKEAIPSIVKRNFSRVAALLETADLEFTKLKNTLLVYELGIEAEITRNPEMVDLNDISLVSFGETSSIVNELDRGINFVTKTNLIEEMEIDTSEIPKLKYLGVTNIEQLSFLLENKKNDIIGFAKNFICLVHRSEGGSTNRGISLFYLCYLLIAEKENEDELLKFVNLFWDLKRYPELPNQIISAYKKLKTEKIKVT